MATEQKKFPTILRGLIALERVIQTQRPISATELLEELDLPIPTVNRILQKLEEERRVECEPVGRRCMPGPRTRGMVAVAVPVFNVANEICLTVAVRAPRLRMPVGAPRQYVPALRKAAAAVAATYCSAGDDEA